MVHLNLSLPIPTGLQHAFEDLINLCGSVSANVQEATFPHSDALILNSHKLFNSLCLGQIQLLVGFKQCLQSEQLWAQNKTLVPPRRIAVSRFVKSPQTNLLEPKRDRLSPAHLIAWSMHLKATVADMRRCKVQIMPQRIGNCMIM
jgi:hypothetical protein